MTCSGYWKLDVAAVARIERGSVVVGGKEKGPASLRDAPVVIT
jgi:hypothetical protein